MDNHGDLFVADDWLEASGNERMLRFDAKSLPVGNTSCALAFGRRGVWNKRKFYLSRLDPI